MSDRDARKQGPLANRRFLLAAAVVAILVLLAVIIVVTQLVPGHRTTADPTSTPSTSSNSSATPTDADPSSCGLPGYETRNTLSGPPETNWELVGTVAAPTSPKTVGPGVVESNGFRSCFAHTAEGALFAAANVIALGSDGQLGRELTDKLVVPGAGRNAALKAQGSGSSAAPRYQIAGYQLLAYDSRRARVDLALNLSTGDLVSFVTTLQWSSGDWKVVLTDDGQSPVKPAPLSNLGGYTPWSGA